MTQNKKLSNSVEKPTKTSNKKSQPKKELTADDVFENYRQGWKKHSPGWYAILTHDNAELSRLLKENAPKIIQENNTVSDLLGLALSFKNYEAATMLLENGNAKNFKNAMGVGAIHMAAKYLKTPEEYDKAKAWLLKNEYDLSEAYEYNKETYTFESIAQKSMSIPPITWVSDYNPLFEKKPQWVKDKEEKIEKEKKQANQKFLEEAQKKAKEKNDGVENKATLEVKEKNRKAKLK